VKLINDSFDRKASGSMASVGGIFEGEKSCLAGIEDSEDGRLSSLVFSRGGWLVSTQGPSSWITTHQAHRWTRRIQVEGDGIRSGGRRYGVGERPAGTDGCTHPVTLPIHVTIFPMTYVT